MFEIPMTVLYTLYACVPVFGLAVLGLLGTLRMAATAPPYRNTAHYTTAGRLLIGVMFACIIAPFVAYAVDVYVLTPAIGLAFNALAAVPLEPPYLAAYAIGMVCLGATIGTWWNKSLASVARHIDRPRHRAWHRALRAVQALSFVGLAGLVAAIYNGLV